MNQDERTRPEIEDRVSVRIFTDVIEEAKKIVRERPDKYANLSHYLRAAVLRQNNIHNQEDQRANGPQESETV